MATAFPELLDPALTGPALIAAADRALAAGDPAAVVAALAPRHTSDPALLQRLGLAHRALQDSGNAQAVFARAAALRPADPLLAHSAARTALEAGLPAAALFERARSLAKSDSGILLGHMAALLAEGRGEDALDQLERLLAGNPGWSEGHLAHARIAAMLRPADLPGATVRTALEAHPAAPGLWGLRLQLLRDAKAWDAVIAALAEARAVLGPSPDLDRIEAGARSELGQADAAQALFAALPAPADGNAAIAPVRNLIRLGDFADARALAERSYPGDSDLAMWPYRGLLWRQAGDPRWEWLEGDDRLIRSYDIKAELGPLDKLNGLLRSLHRGTGQPLDQSLRGGTQTDGHLLIRAEPELRRLRAALLAAAAEHIAQLPAAVPGHPTLLARRDPVILIGAWSVRLADAGFHVDHTHQHGWFSSALHLALPADPGPEPHAGWLTFGECRALLPDLTPFRMIEPRAGVLTLFPSTMWHGTRPFAAGERLTVAADIGRPPQG